MAMKFTVQRNTFLEGIQKTLSIVEKKTTMPILNNILLKTDNHKIKIVATDREIGLVADYDAEIITEGHVTVSARKLYEMIREIQGDSIQFESNESHRVTVTCQKIMYKISGLPADDFPSVIDDRGDVVFHTMKGQLIEELISKTSFAMSGDEMRKNLNGVLFETIDDGGKKTLRMVATDGHRLAIANADIGEESSFTLEKGIIIPKKGLNEIKRLIEDAPEEVSLGVRQGMCIVKTNSTMLRVSLVDAEYPDYRRVVPAEKGIVIKFEKNALLHALRRMSVVSSERYSGVIFTLSDGKMMLESTNPDVGEAKEEIEVAYHDQNISMGYNVKYLIDAIEVIDEETVIFEMGVGMKPGVIKPASNDEYVCIVMPLKVQ
ncbi:MAG TPA: DNA polymerase III subunit beta [Syntrophaceae bacterium]|jgi:DNA polymerase-3 subunit beta|nr:DNA polymerase III subunit beta [Syntrophaceae bacterium]